MSMFKNRKTIKGARKMAESPKCKYGDLSVTPNTYTNEEKKRKGQCSSSRL